MSRVDLHRAALLLALLALSACNPDGAPPAQEPQEPQVVHHALSVTRSGEGRVVSTPAGIDCGAQCSFLFDEGASISLQATPGNGQAFDGWDGDCSGAGACVVTMTQARSVTARFVTPPPPPPPPPPADFELSVSLAGDGAGRVTSVPAGIDCPSQCSARFGESTEVRLQALADAGSEFSGWSGACSGAADCVVTISADLSLGAGFALLPLQPPAPVGVWLKGDLHVHTDHSSDGSGPRQCCDDRGPGNVSVADQIGFATLMGLDFLPLTDHRTYDQHYDPLWESADLLLIPGEEANGSPHATVHGATDTIVQGAAPPELPGFVHLQQSIWDAHCQGAVWITAHPDDGEVEDDGVTPNVRASAVGIDLVETWNKASNVEEEIAYAENRWNAGFRFGVAGASDDHFRELWAVAGPGMPTTRVFAAERRERGLLDALRAGRTVISADPQLAPIVTIEADFQGDGVFEAIAGDEVYVPANTAGVLRVRAQFAGGNDVRVYAAPGRSGGPLAEFAPTLPEIDVSYLIDVVASDTPSWYRAEVRGVGPVAGLDTGDVPLSLIPEPQTLPDQLRAMTSPIFVSTVPAEATGEIPVPADAGGEDGAEQALGEAGRFAGFPDLARSDDALHVVAELHVPSATRVHYRRRNSDGRWSDPVALSGDSARARFPRIAARGDDVWVVWQDERDGQQPRRGAIYLRHSPDSGTTWSPESLLRAIDGRAEHPDIALTAGGSPLVVWQEISAGNPFDVMAQRIGHDTAPINLSRSGKTISAADPVDSRSARYPASVRPSVAVADDGRMAIAWQDNRNDPDPLWTGSALAGEGTDPDDWQIMITTRADNETTWAAPQALGGSDRADRHPAVAFDSNGDLVVAWDSKELRSSGANLAVLAARSADGGASFEASAPIAPLDSAMSQYPQLGRDADGRLRAVWYDSRASDWRWRVMTARRVDDAWADAALLFSKGINTWPATDGGAIAFASTRNALRLQRDVTQQIFVVLPP